MSFWKKKDNLIITGVVAAFFIGLLVWYKGNPITPNSASANPFEMPFITKDQQQVNLNSFKGKPLIVNFWATWCSVCVKKMGTLNRFAEKFQAKGGQIVAISQDRGGIPVVESYFQRNGYNNLAIYLEPSGALGQALNVQGYPTTIFVDAQGNEIGRVAGGIDWESSEIQELIKQYYGIDVGN